MSESTIGLAGAERPVQPTVSDGRRLRRRHLWLIPGLGLAIVANQLGTANGVGILALVAFGIAPDLPRLFGSRGRPAHNVLHQPVLAAVAVAASAALTTTGLAPLVVLVGSLVWLGHVVIGWAVGDVPRDGRLRRDA